MGITPGTVAISSTARQRHVPAGTFIARPSLIAFCFSASNSSVDLSVFSSPLRADSPNGEPICKDDQNKDGFKGERADTGHQARQHDPCPADIERSSTAVVQNHQTPFRTRDQPPRSAPLRAAAVHDEWVAANLFANSHLIDPLLEDVMEHVH